MKTKPVILLAAISALLATGASAQQETPPAGAPPTPPGARDSTPPPDRPRGGDAPRPGARPDGAKPEGARPDGQRGDGFRLGPPRGEGGPREGGPRDGGANKVEGPRDGVAPGGPREGGGPRQGFGPNGPREGFGGPRPGSNPGGPRVNGPREGAPGPGEDRGPREGAPHNSTGARGDFHRGDGPRDLRHEGAPEVRKEKRAFLGIVAVPLPAVLSAQLGMAEGYGLFVQAIAPESPAAKAGVQKYDVIKLLNDQQIVDQGQLATLVKGLGNGKEITLTVLRKGQEQKILTTLGEHEVPVGTPEHHGFGGLSRPSGLDFGRGPDHLRDNSDRFKEFGDRMRQFQEQMRNKGDREKQDDDSKRKPEGRGPREGFGRPGAAVDPERLLQEAKPTGGSQIRVESQVGTTTINGAQAHLRMKDASGEIEVATEEGKRVLTARDPAGKVIFTGPVNTEEERAAVPEPIRKKLADIHIRQVGNGVAAGISVGEELTTSAEKAPFSEADFQ